MRKLLFCLLLLNTTVTYSQSVRWYEGSLVLKSDAVYSGRMTFDPVLGVVLIESASTNERHVFNAHQVKEIYYYDVAMNVNRRFMSLCDSAPGHHDDTFYEMILQGEASLLRRQKMRIRHPEETDYDYYTLYQDAVRSLRRFKKDVYPEMTDTLSSLEDFRRDNFLYPGSPVDAIQLIEFYNHSIRSAGVLAMQ